MTEERMQELRQLLEEAKESLEIRYEHGIKLIPVDVYRKYLEELWTYYGVDLLSFSQFRLSVRFTLDIVNKSRKSNLLDFIREELAHLLDEDEIAALSIDSVYTATYFIVSDSTNRLRIYRPRLSHLYLSWIIDRLLEITLVRGAEMAVAVLEECSSPKGAHVFFQNVALIDGIKLEKAIQVYEGVRLVPLPSSEISEELSPYLTNLPANAFSDGFINSTNSFFGKTLLVIDLPGFSLLHKPASNPGFSNGLPVDELPFQVEVQDLKFPDFKAVNSFKELFCQALFLACSYPVQIVRGYLFFGDDRSFSPHQKTLTMRGDFTILESSTEVGEPKIEETKRLYHILVELYATDGENKDSSNQKEKLRIAIDRWIKSKTDGSLVDKIIDLGIAFEVLYVPDGGGDITYKFSIRAARHLGNDKEHRKELLTKFKNIYRCRSDAVHGGKLGPTVKFGVDSIPVSDFIERAQDLCRQSILKIIEDGKFPDWDSLILGGEVEQVSGA